MATDPERKELADRMRMQTLATCNNYYYTGQHRKALNVLNKMLPMFPGDQMVETLMSSICRSAFESGQVADFSLLNFSPNDNGLSDIFGKNWLGEDLNGKSITVFCDQGMGDTINLMRYLNVMREKWDCKICLNCYAYYEEMVSLMDYIDQAFTNSHAKNDYHTNIMSIPALLNGLEYDCYYPAHFRDLLETDIPNEPYISVKGHGKVGFERLGLAWKSNPKNPLSEKKSIDLELFAQFANDLNIYNLLPYDGDFLFGAPMKNLLETAQNIEDMDLVISVDTVVLHLAGAMGKPVWGLLPYSADPRWGEEETTPWYPTMKLYRQKESDNWEEVLERVAEDLVEWQNQRC